MDTETTTDREALDYRGVGDVNQPIGIVPILCGRYVCPNQRRPGRVCNDVRAVGRLTDRAIPTGR